MTDATLAVPKHLFDLDLSLVTLRAINFLNNQDSAGDYWKDTNGFANVDCYASKTFTVTKTNDSDSNYRGVLPLSQSGDTYSLKY
jgi:hypothetical protein